LKRKNPWAHYTLIFSALHNFMSLSKQPRAYYVSQTPGLSIHPSTAPLFKHMKVFNGLVGFFLIYSIWGNTYFFSWYGLYDNP